MPEPDNKLLAQSWEKLKVSEVHQSGQNPVTSPVSLNFMHLKICTTILIPTTFPCLWSVQPFLHLTSSCHLDLCFHLPSDHFFGFWGNSFFTNYFKMSGTRLILCNLEGCWGSIAKVTSDFIFSNLIDMSRELSQSGLPGGDTASTGKRILWLAIT